MGAMLLQRGLLALAVSGVLCLPACGSPDVDAAATEPVNTSGSASSGTGGQPGAAGTSTAAGGASAGASGAAAGAAPVAGSGGGLSLAACSSLMDDSNAWSLVIQIKNERKETLYLGQDTTTCEAQRLFQVEDGARKVLANLESCHNSCEALMQTGPVTCPNTCPTPSTLTLNPGQTIKVPWDGRYGLVQSLPQQCAVASSQGMTSCMQAQRIEPSVFTFSARAGTSHSCLAAGGCNCTADQYGSCTTPSSLITGTIITTEYLIKLEPGMMTAGEPPYIALVFKD
jgi:hypothetical protein